METTCPYCSQGIEIDPPTLQSLQGQPHFDCPVCGGGVPVPGLPAGPRRGAMPPPGPVVKPMARRHPAPVTKTQRGMHRNLLVLGTLTLLTLGGLAVFLASRDAENNIKTATDIRNEILNNSYFTNLIASGATTEKDLEAVTDIRAYRGGFIGVSKENLTYGEAVALAAKTGSGILAVEDSSVGSWPQLRAWLKISHNSALSSPTWLSQAGEHCLLDAPNLHRNTSTERAVKAFLHWKTDDTNSTRGQKSPLTTPSDVWPVINRLPAALSGRVIAMPIQEGANVLDSDVGAIPSEIVQLNDLIKISISGGHALALSSAGKVFAWGSEGGKPRHLPVEMTGEISKVVQIIAGSTDAVLLENGKVLLAEGGGHRLAAKTAFRKIGGQFPSLYGFDGSNKITYIGPDAGRSPLDVPQEFRTLPFRDLKGSGRTTLALTMTGDVVVWGTDEFGASKILSGMRAELIEDPAVLINMEGHASMVLTVQKSGKVTFSGINSRYYDPVQFGCDNAINSWILFQDNNYWAACMIQNGNPGSTTYNLIEKSFAANGTPSRANFFRQALSHYMPSEIAMDDFRSPRSGILLMIVPSNNK